MLSVDGAFAKNGKTIRVGRKQHNPSIFDKLFSIYLTPKALKGIKAKGDNFAKIVKEARNKSKRHLNQQHSDLN